MIYYVNKRQKNNNPAPVLFNRWLCFLQQRPVRRSWWRQPTWQRPLRSRAATWQPSLAGMCPQPYPTSRSLVTRWPGRRSSPPTATTASSCPTASSPSPRSYPRSVLLCVNLSDGTCEIKWPIANSFSCGQHFCELKAYLSQMLTRLLRQNFTCRQNTFKNI